jgi:hypothetical protein
MGYAFRLSHKGHDLICLPSFFQIRLKERLLMRRGTKEIVGRK